MTANSRLPGGSLRNIGGASNRLNSNRSAATARGGSVAGGGRHNTGEVTTRPEPTRIQNPRPTTPAMPGYKWTQNSNGQWVQVKTGQPLTPGQVQAKKPADAPPMGQEWVYDPKLLKWVPRWIGGVNLKNTAGYTSAYGMANAEHGKNLSDIQSTLTQLPALYARAAQDAFRNYYRDLYGMNQQFSARGMYHSGSYDKYAADRAQQQRGELDRADAEYGGLKRSELMAATAAENQKWNAIQNDLIVKAAQNYLTQYPGSISLANWLNGRG